MAGSSEIFEAASEALGLGLKSAAGVTGGDINSGFRLEFDDGTTAFFKTRRGAPPEEFEMEAAGLEWLAAADGPPVPEVLAVIRGPQPGLLLEWIDGRGRLKEGTEEEFGRGLANIHAVDPGGFGALPPGAPAWGLHVGPVPLTQAPQPDEGQGFAGLYAERIEDLAAQAQDRGALELDEVATLTDLCENIDEFAGPPEPPSLTHGDLWSGNVLVSADSRPYLIDPAAHGAHRELDLAMLELFGSLSPVFYDSYEEIRPLADGWRERISLWQVQPLLIHAVLFGGSYGRSAVGAARSLL